mgnify:CR=1 FL=1
MTHLAVFIWYYRMSVKQFGGVTGDLAGCFLQVCELAGLAAAAVLLKAGLMEECRNDLGDRRKLPGQEGVCQTVPGGTECRWSCLDRGSRGLLGGIYGRQVLP